MISNYREPIIIENYEPPTPKTLVPGKQIEYFFSEQFSAYMDIELRTMWLRWKPAPRPNFNPLLLHDLSRCCHFLSRSEAAIENEGDSFELDCTVLASGLKGIYNLGGDLKLFLDLIRSNDFNSLLDYGCKCIDVLYQNYIAHRLPIITISLVQGACLGGGFEAALSSDIVIAERNARFGFPEILFNLFPGMGAYSFLERRIGQRNAESIISSGKTYSADEMLELGVIDVVAPEGEGESEVANYIQSRIKNKNGLVGMAAARRIAQKLEYEELYNIVRLWVEKALNLSDRDLKLMQRIVSRQNEV